MYLKMSSAMMTSSNEKISALLALCARNSSVTGELPWQRPVTRSFDIIFDLRVNKRLSKQLRGWWFETPLRPSWRNCNGMVPRPWCIQIMRPVLCICLKMMRKSIIRVTRSGIHSASTKSLFSRFIRVAWAVEIVRKYTCIQIHKIRTNFVPGSYWLSYFISRLF